MRFQKQPFKKKAGTQLFFKKKSNLCSQRKKTFQNNILNWKSLIFITGAEIMNEWQFL